MMHQKIFRVFVSSTFSDFSAERNVLQKRVFPELERRCREVGGTFLGVDLRWGISPQRSLSNRTVTTCLEEIRRCQALSPKPNFLILLGDRYGWIPLPESIPEAEWGLLLQQMSGDEAALVNKWYALDENADPHARILKPRTDEWEYQNVWEERAEVPMRMAFRRAADALPEARRLAYCAAATHQEIVRGMFEATDEDHVVAWCRKLTDAPEGPCWQDAHAGLGPLKTKVLERAGERGIERAVDYEEIRGFQETSSVDADTPLTPYLEDFAKWVTDRLWLQIATEAGRKTGLGLEELQDQFIDARAEGVVGRDKEVAGICLFLSKSSGGVHLVSGPGGQGKTSLLALACRQLETESDQGSVWVKRFAEAGGGIDSIEALLASLIPDALCDQFWEREILPELLEKRVYPGYRLEQDISEKAGSSVSLPRYPKPGKPPETVPGEMVAQLRDQTKAALLSLRSELIVKVVGDIGAPRNEHLAAYFRFVRYLKGCDLIVVLDGIDQWYGAPDFLKTIELLAWTGRDALKGIWLIASARTLAGMALEGLGQEVWESIAIARLAQHERSLSAKQWDWVKSGREHANGNPLSLRVGLEQALRLHSFDDVPGVRFEYRALLRYWIDDITGADEHGELARRALAFLSVAEFGLPEPVLLELLAGDGAVRDWFGTQVAKTGQIWDLANGLPPILWSRLQMDLGDVVAVSGEAGRNVLRLFHSAFRDELASIVNAGAGEREAIARAAERHLAAGGDGFAEGNVAARLYESADPWALKEVLVQWRHVAPATLDQLMELPAFAMAVVSLPQAFDAWVDAEEPPPRSAQLRALLRLHMTELRLLASGLDRIRLVLQEAFPKGTLNAAGLHLLAWTNEVEFPWIRDLWPEDALISPVGQAALEAFSLCRASGERLAIFLGRPGGDLSRLAVVEPQSLGKAPLFMTVRDYCEKGKVAIQSPEFKDFIECDDLFVTRHAVGPIRLWNAGREVARFVCDLGRNSGASGLPAEVFAKISEENILVLYEGGLAAIVDFSNLEFDEGEPVLELKASGSGGRFQVVHQEDDLDEDGRWVGVRRDGDDFSLLLMKSLSPILVHRANGVTVVKRCEHAVHHGFDGYSLVCGLGWAAFWSLSNAMIVMSADGERIFNAPGKDATTDPIAFSDTRRTLYCVWNYLDDSQGKPKYIDRLVAIDLEAVSMRWQGPAIGRHRIISAGEYSYLLFEQDDRLAIMRLGDEAEPRIVLFVSSDGFWPDAHLFDAASGLIIASSGRSIALIDPANGACSVVLLESPITDFELIDSLIAIAHGDGVLRTYRLNDVKTGAGGESPHLWAPTCIAQIGDKHLITASVDRWLLWQADAPGSLLPSVLWEAGSSGKDRRIRHALPLDNGCVTWGDEIIFWKWVGTAERLEEEHKIWNTSGAKLNCNGMVLELGGNDFLFEYGSDYPDIPGTIGRVRWTGLEDSGDWRENAKWVADVFAAHAHKTQEDRRYRSIISPVFPDGWVLVGETAEPTYSQTESVAAYNIHSEETRVGMASRRSGTDPWLIELLERHRGWLLELKHRRSQEMLRWGGGMTSDSGTVEMPSIYNFPGGPRDDDVDSIVRFRRYQGLTTQRVFMFRDMLGMTSPSQRNIGIRAADGENVPYISSSSFRVEASMVSKRGIAVVTDNGGKLRWLQLMHGSRPCAGQEY